MTPTLCPITGKPQLSAAAAQRQKRNTKRAVIAAHCSHCGRWHVNSPVFQTRQERRDRAAVRDARTAPMETEE